MKFFSVWELREKFRFSVHLSTSNLEGKCPFDSVQSPHSVCNLGISSIIEYSQVSHNIPSYTYKSKVLLTVFARRKRKTTSKARGKFKGCAVLSFKVKTR
uniref:Uncharacterized protein n=1 Tax=Cacopsylla melanoneura TaxID=428564 RepID=A0A8D8YU67_9HEMI